VIGKRDELRDWDNDNVKLLFERLTRN